MTTLDTYYLLGRTGLRVSPLGLGTMTFGESPVGSHPWRAEEDASRTIFRNYLDAGGNLVDTANAYGNGRSEELVGKFIRETGSRDRIVLATKFTVGVEPGNPNAAGNGRKNIIASLDASLRRLNTDYVDLYWLHMWDTMTPVEEVMSTFDALVRSGKIRAVGLSDVPAWYAAKAQMLARARGWEPVAALQLEYSLIERNIEREHVPAAQDLGMAIVPWSPLAQGFLSGKYARSDNGPAGSGRLQALPLRQHADQHWAVLDALQRIAKDLERTPAQIALNWVTRRPGVVSTLIGARTPQQLRDNLAALDFDPTDDQLASLADVGRLPVYQPYNLFSGESRTRISGGGADVRREPAWYRG